MLGTVAALSLPLSIRQANTFMFLTSLGILSTNLTRSSASIQTGPHYYDLLRLSSMGADCLQHVGALVSIMRMKLTFSC